MVTRCENRISGTKANDRERKGRAQKIDSYDVRMILWEVCRQRGTFPNWHL